MELLLEDRLFEGNSPSEIQNNLEALCQRVKEEYNYSRKLSKEEKEELRERISDLSVQIKTQKNKLKEFSTPLKEEIKDLDKQRDLATTDLQRGRVEEKGRLYLFPDETTKTIHEYDKYGIRVNVRPMNPEERQHYIMPHINTGTNG
jgi:uncharacterized coiled-coil protein SlyX